MSEINSLLSFINESIDNSLTYFNTSFITRYKRNDSEFIELSKSIFDDYLSEIKEKSVIIALDEQEYSKYAYKPELLAFDIYGSTELYFIILLLNDLSSPKEFNLKKIRMLTRADCIDILNTIFNAEEDVINENRKKSREE